MVNSTPRPLYPRERDPIPIAQEAEWAPGPVWMGAKNLAPIGIRSPHRPARSDSLYRLRYLGPYEGWNGRIIKVFRVHAMKAYRGSGSVPPLILCLGIRCAFNFTPPAGLPSGNRSDTHRIRGWVGGPWRQSGHFGEEKNLLRLPGCETWYL